MAAKRKSEAKNIAPMGISILRDDLKTALEPVATALSEELAALLAAVLDGRKRKTFDSLRRRLARPFPLFSNVLLNTSCSQAVMRLVNAGRGWSPRCRGVKHRRSFRKRSPLGKDRGLRQMKTMTGCRPTQPPSF